MIIDTNQRKFITALTGVFGGSPKVALQTVELLNPKTISQINPQASQENLETYQSLAIISKGFAPRAFASGGSVGIIVEREGTPQLAEVFANDHKIGAIVVQILQGKLTKPEEVQSQIEALFGDEHKAEAGRIFNLLLNKAG